MDERLRKLLERVLSDIAEEVNAYQAGDLTIAQWRRQMETTIGDGHRAAYLLAADTRALDPSARAWLARVVADQVDTYLDSFVADVRAGNVSAAMMRARAALYAGALKATWSEALWWGWPLPFHPADGKTPCLVNCGCHWEGKNLDEAQKNGDFYWVFGKQPHSEHCPGCEDRYQEGKPYLIRKGKLQ